MMHVRRFFHRIATLLRSGRAETDLSREISAHLQLLEDEFVAKGMPREDARYAAKRAFGGVDQAKELQRDARSFRWLAGWSMDLKLGARMLVKSPGLTIVAVTALAVAIGAGAAYLEFTRDLLDPKLDVAGGERIVGIRLWNAERRADETHTVRDFALWRPNIRTIADLGASRPVSRDLTTADGRTEPARTVAISASAFRLFPTAPLYGRTLSEDDERPDADPVAVIGHDLWKSRLNRDPNAVGSTVRLGSTVHTIVGVMPEGFGFPVNNNLWLPLKGSGPVTKIFGRLEEGATAAAAETEAQTLIGDERRSVRAVVRPYLESRLGDSPSEVTMVRAVNIIFILLLGICGANVATLVFARTALREGEISLRTALGASRGRISAQLFAEALVLCLVAAGAGLLAAEVVGRWVTGLYVQEMGPTPFWWDDGLGYETILYAIALAVFAAAIVGLVPALKATGRELQGRIREGASGTSTLKFGGLWTAVIVTQAAITVIVLAAVVSLGWSTVRKQAGTDVIYPRERLLTARIEIDASPDRLRQDSGDQEAPAYGTVLRAIADRLGGEPGIAGVSYTTALPGTIFEQFVFELQSPELQAQADARKVTDVLWSEGASVGERFFETAGIPLVSGRLFTDAEIRQGAAVAIVDETFVRTVLAGRSPIGVTVRQRGEERDDQPGPWLEIIGVVKDASLAERNGPDDGSLYRPASPGRPMRLLVRTHVPASSMTQSVYAAALSVDPDIRLADLKSMAQVSEEAALPERIFLLAFSVIGAIALLLGTAGIYSLISFTLARRTREIGIRVALGAAPRGIITGVFSRAFTQIGLGVAAGALPGLVVLQSVAGDVGSMSNLTCMAAVLGVCVLVILVALASCTVPLRRALRIQPTDALRAQ